MSDRTINGAKNVSLAIWVEKQMIPTEYKYKGNKEN